eukprot:scaffold974_cov176-Ochromonas_danica.AAC.1
MRHGGGAMENSIVRYSCPLRVSLTAEGNGRAIPMVLLSPPCPCLQEGVCSLSFVVKESARLENQFQPTRCVLVCEAVDGENRTTAIVRSSPFICVTHQLMIKEEHEKKYEFYKDVGGKDKGIEFKVSLVDAVGQPALHFREVAITPILHYENGQEVADQSILQTADEKGHLVIQGAEVKDLKFRINQVSSKHLNQAFVIELRPDLLRSPTATDVKPVFSVPVEVKSKVKRAASEVITAQRQRSRLENQNQIFSQSWMSTVCSSDAATTVHQLAESMGEFSESVQQVSRWCDEVALALENKVKWKPLGYENVTGEKGRVLVYEMANPNETVHHFLSRYREKVSKSLATLSQVRTMLQQLQPILPSSSSSEAPYAAPVDMDGHSLEPSLVDIYSRSCENEVEGMRGVRNINEGGAELDNRVGQPVFAPGSSSSLSTTSHVSRS